jgi:hypothetical protein
MRKGQFQLFLGILLVISLVVSVGFIYYFSLKPKIEINQSTTTTSKTSTTISAIQPTSTSITTSQIPDYSIYIHAHPDDWQAAMEPFPYYDAQAGKRIIFIILTAGDAGKSDAFWQGREAGAIASMQQLPVSGYGSSSGFISVNNHSIWTVTYRIVTTVFMRLPDGSGDNPCGSVSLDNLTFGLGTAARNCQSLYQTESLGKAITSDDGSTTYSSWSDLLSTIQKIVDYYNIPHTSNTILNIPEYDRGLNPTDHADHYATADIGNELGSGWVVRLFIGYDALSRPANLDSLDQIIKTNSFQAYINGMTEAYGSCDINMNMSRVQAWIQRTYFRTI